MHLHAPQSAAHEPRMLPLSTVQLSDPEAVGDRSRALGLIGERMHHLPANHVISQQHVAYRWPADRRHHPLPPRFFA